MIIHLLIALKILNDNNLLYTDWHHYDNIMFDNGKPKFIDFGITTSLSDAYKSKIRSDIIKSKIQEDPNYVINEKELNLLVEKIFTEKPIDNYNNDFSITEVSFICSLFRGMLNRLERKFGKCVELEAILNPLEENKDTFPYFEPVNIILDKLTQLKQKLDNPLQQDGGYCAYAKYLKYKSKLKSLH